jgi:hypothetical protein
MSGAIFLYNVSKAQKLLRSLALKCKGSSVLHLQVKAVK